MKSINYQTISVIKKYNIAMFIHAGQDYDNELSMFSTTMHRKRYSRLLFSRLFSFLHHWGPELALEFPSKLCHPATVINIVTVYS